MSRGTAMGEGQRQQMLSTAQGQAQAGTQAELAEIARGSQANVGASGQTQEAQSAAQDRQRQSVQTAQSQVNQLDAQMMQQAYQKYQEGLQTLAAMEYARRQAALGELEKLSPDAIAGAFQGGQAKQAGDVQSIDTSTTEGLEVAGGAGA